MKIGLCCNGTFLSEDFSDCEKLQVFEVREGKIIKEEVLEIARKGDDFLFDFFKSQGIGVLIAGRIGKRTVDKLNEMSIALVSGVEGEGKTLVEAYLRGELSSTEMLSNSHHKGEEGKGRTDEYHWKCDNSQINHIQDEKPCGH